MGGTKVIANEGLWSTRPQKGARLVLTGSTGGLGRALGDALAAAGAEVVGLDRPGSIAATGHRLIEVDLTDAEATRAAVDAAAGILGGLDGVIGAAGVVDTVHRAESFSDQAFRADIAVNLTAQFTVAQAAFPYLQHGQHASIVFVASQAGLDGLPGQVSYAASKAGVVGLTASLATEWVSHGIRVNAVAPGLFDTPKVAAMPASARDRMLTGVPMRRTASLAEVIGPILFLLSPGAGYMTGRTLRVDGGAGLTMTGFFR